LVIIILAAVQIRPEKLEEALKESNNHVVRSRAEPGCVSHGVHQDHEDANRLVFVERWADRDAMRTHFGVPEARAFAALLAELADQPPEMQVYEAEPLT
jgi:quinol monooxygenase YgiN